MIQVITKENAAEHGSLLKSMFALRYHVFIETLGWGIDCEPGQEKDQFDTQDAIYLVLPNDNGDVVASTRLLPTVGPNLLLDVFPQLVAGRRPVSRTIWEASRLVVDHRRDRLRSCRNAAGQLLCGIMEYAVRCNLSHLVSVSDVRIERLLTRLGWTLARLGAPIHLDGYDLAAEITAVSRSALERIRARTAIHGSVLTADPASEWPAAA
jgi:acyl homoserine lactone synthase